ncbi:Uncharacterized protein DAT39_014552 [Clarias magur]|uniref:Uncharacterized protein n=1 Tax=Clarias magur TaxID=1594786 RepID=A0A8J4TTI1_CLAMG|nr:Uncharacterized protein DAT39_014552 [Clarias magur]
MGGLKSVRGSLPEITSVSWNGRAYSTCAQACVHGMNHICEGRESMPNHFHLHSRSIADV